MKPKRITATSITLVDSSGRPRIALDGGGDSGCASISVISPTEQYASIIAQPDGSLGISLDHDNIRLALTLGPSGLVIRDSAGLLAVTIGDLFHRGEPSITVYREGQPVWSAPTPTPQPK